MRSDRGGICWAAEASCCCTAGSRRRHLRAGRLSRRARSRSGRSRGSSAWEKWGFSKCSFRGSGRGNLRVARCCCRLRLSSDKLEWTGLLTTRSDRPSDFSPACICIIVFIVLSTPTP